MSLNDILRWDAALRGDSIFDEAGRAELYTPALEGYSLGWQVERTAAGDLKVSHGGATRGYRAQLIRIPARGIVIAVLTNDRHDPSKLARKLLEELLPEERTGVEAVLSIGGLAFNEYKAAVISEGVQAQVARAKTELNGGPAQLQLTVSVPTGEARTEAVRIGLAPKLATSTATEIRDALKRKPRGTAMPEGTKVLLGTMPYSAVNGQIRLPDEVKLVVMPRYTGQGEDGKPIIDERICLVLMDEANGFWPVILKLDRAAAESLADQLEQRP